MKRIFIFMLFVNTAVQAIAADRLTKLVSFGKNPGNLNAFTFFSNEQDSLKKPLVVVLHGCSQNANSCNQQSGWSLLAKKYNFNLLFPEQKRINNPNNCFNWFYAQDTKNENGESFSIYEMIIFLIKNKAVDPQKIFITGLSAGAVMSVAVLANYPSLFKSGAILAGGPYYGESVSPIEALSLMKNPPVLSGEELRLKIPPHNLHDSVPFPKLIVLHGDKDHVVNYNNSLALIAQWCALHKMDSIPDQKIETYHNNPLITRFSYSNLKGEQLVFYSVKGIGHALPVDPGKRIDQGGKTGLFAKDINFYSIYHIAKEFGLIHF